MAEPAFTLKLIAPDGSTKEHAVVAVTAPGELGRLGILAHHAPLVTTLERGLLVWRAPEGPTQQQELPGGLLEVRDNVVIVLASAVTAPTRPR